MNDDFIVPSENNIGGWKQDQDIGLNNEISVEWTSFIEYLSTVIPLSDSEDSLIWTKNEK